MDVDEYVKGVLPYEMSTGWPAEALKAQAVASKSYALACRQVRTDTRSQVYGPLRYPDTDAAAQAVRDIYLGFGSEIIAAFFFGHCNGRTRSPSEAGWNPIADRPYLRAVPCICGRTSYYGHGIGMCQRGAEAMALQGATYDQILRRYYTGAQILGLDAGPPALQRPPANAETYTVQPGDTLSGIGAALGIPWPAIHAANAGLIVDPALIQVGWVLVIPRSAEEEGEAGLYVVQPGDTLGALAQAWGSSASDIALVNSIADPNFIRVGQRLRKP
jgi:LysM repeat protein